MGADELARADAAYRLALKVAERERVARDALLARCVARGMSQTDAARVLGVTRARVGQILAPYRASSEPTQTDTSTSGASRRWV